MHSTHAQSPGSTPAADQALAAVLEVVGSVVGHQVRPHDELEAGLAIDSIDLARIAAALPFDVHAGLARLDFDRLTALTVADLAELADPVALPGPVDPVALPAGDAR